MWPTFADNSTQFVYANIRKIKKKHMKVFVAIEKQKKSTTRKLSFAFKFYDVKWIKWINEKKKLVPPKK